MKRRYDQNAQRTILVPARPSITSREEIAEIDGELINRANRLGEGYQPIAKNEQDEEIDPESKEQIEDPESDGESQII